MKLKNILGNKEKASKKKILLLFLIIFIPNLFRQVMYFITSNIYNSNAFISSFETKVIYGTNFLFFGVIEEIIIGIVFTYFWFNYKNLMVTVW